MFHLASSLCALCEARTLLEGYRATWQPTRAASTLQKRKPSRMVLSPDVQKGPPRSAAGARYERQSRNNPFGATNLTVAPRDLVSAREQASNASRRRSPKDVKGRSGKNGEIKDPMKALKMQRALASVSYEKRGRVKQALIERDQFQEFDLLPVIQESVVPQALGGLIDATPTPIQRLAIPALLGAKEKGSRQRFGEVVAGKKDIPTYLLAAETGSGKTLAYVLPVIDAMKRAELEEAEHARQEAVVEQRRQQERARNTMFEIEPPEADQPDPYTARPRAIILVPTAELVEQVGRLVKSLSHTVKYRTALLSANYSGTVIRNRLFTTGGIDVVISTPHLLTSITESDPNILARVTHLVIDEADSLLDRSFSPTTSVIIDRSMPSLHQLIMCSATIPRSLDTYLQKRFPQTKRLVTPNLHAIPRRVQLGVVDIEKVPYQGNRDLACAQTIWEIGKEGVGQDEDREQKIVVFVNEREKTFELAAYLQAKGVDATALSRDSDDRKKADVLAAFTGSSLPISPRPNTTPASTSKSPSMSYKPDNHQRPSATASAPPTRQLQNVKVLVMTDIGSRGIDTTLVRHVILYDVPHTSIDFIHRLGRVGRMGRRGRGTVLIGRHDRKDVVKEVREGMFRGQALI